MPAALVTVKVVPPTEPVPLTVIVPWTREETVVPAGMPGPGRMAPVWSENGRPHGNPVTTGEPIVVFPGDPENSVGSDVPPGKPGCVNTTRVPITSMVGGVQSPVVGGEAGRFALAIPEIVRKAPVAILYAKGMSFGDRSHDRNPVRANPGFVLSLALSPVE